MIDLHSHILRGIDDGARTVEESLEIARAAVAEGISVMAGTPHVRDDWPTGAAVMEARVAELRDELDRAGIALDVRKGGEIAYEWLGRLSVEELRRFGLGGNPRYLLVETPYHGWPLGLDDLLLRLLDSGIRPVLAHPERNASVQAHPERLAELVEAGMLIQVTAASLDGRTGKGVQETALLLVAQGLVHLLASDAHHASVRAVGMTRAASIVGGELAGWMTWEVPAAILGDTPIPLRPHGRPRWVSRLLGLK